MENVIATLKGLTVSTLRGKRGTLTVGEGYEVVRAYRRGVTIAAVAEALGKNPMAVYSALGSWALRHCRLPEDSEV